MLERSLSNTQIFFKRDTIAFSQFETLDNISKVCLGTLLNIKITSKKKKKGGENMTPIIQQKEGLLTV